MANDWLPNDEKLVFRCPYCGEFSFKKRERNLSDNLDFFDYYCNISRTCNLCKKTSYRSTKWWILTTVLASSCAIPIYLGIYLESFLFGIIGLVVIIAATLLTNKYTPLAIEHCDKQKYKHIVISIKNKKEPVWPRYRSGEIYLIIPNKHNYKQQIIAQLESNIRKQLTFRVIKNVDLDLKTGDQVYITDDNNYSIAGVFEKDIPAINNTGDSTLC